MITESMMYWITRLDGIQAVFTVGAIVAILISIITHFAILEGTHTKEDTIEAWHKYKKARWMSYFPIIVCVLVLMFTPTTKEMAMIYAVPAITRSDVVREDLPELYDYGVKALKEQLQEWSEPREPRERHRA